MTQDIRLHNIEKGIKGYGSFILGMLTIFGIIIAGTQIFDKKSDKLDRLSTQVDTLIKQNEASRRQLGDLSVRFNAFKVGDSITKLASKKSQDSLELVVVNIQKQCKAIGRNVAFVIEVKKHGPHSQPTLIPVGN